MTSQVLVVGAGFAGCVIAERLASAGKRVLVVDKREHIAGNTFDEKDSHGILIHRYGPHIFHTNSTAVVEYLSRFTDWLPYEHKVLAFVGGKLYPFPINRTTINRLYSLDLDEQGVTEFLEKSREFRGEIRTSEDYVLNCVGRDLCDKFYRGYTRKQWGLDLKDLNSSVAGRIPVRASDDDRYFSDDFQAMPRDGYAKMFERMLDHKNIDVELGRVFQPSEQNINLTIYTGPIDEYFGFCLGKLPYRSLSFEFEHCKEDLFQPVGQVNYPNDFNFTRITEFKYITGQRCCGTSIVREYPASEGEPYYPIPTEASQVLAIKYRKMAEAKRNVLFIGRLAEYRYYNMDQVVASALKKSEGLR